jgi:Na+/H+ antiporter NhaD/arsenite permease-like protein
MDGPTSITLLVFVITYLGLARGSLPGLGIDRAGIALVGAIALLATSVVTFPQAIHFINFETIGLLLGMMVIVAVLQRARFFAHLASWAGRIVQTPHQLLALVIVLSSVFSAILVNDVICLALPPLIIQLARQRGWDALPHLIALAIASNIGSACTPIGNPQNMLIAEWSQISFLRFIWRLGVPTIISLLVSYVLTAWIFRARLATIQPVPKTLHDVIYVKPSYRHDRLLLKAVLVLLVTVIAFFLTTHLAIVALTMAGILLLDRFSPRFVWKEVDWSLLVMFAGLFVVVGAFDQRIVQPGDWANWPSLQHDPVGLLSLVSAVLSNVVSNVPAVLLFKPIMPGIAPEMQETGWLALAMSSTFAGNFTILGSVANLIVVEQARRAGIVIGFWDYCKVGMPVTIISIAVGVIWLKWF